MTLRSLISFPVAARTQPAPGKGAALAASEPPVTSQVGSFVSTESLITFSGMTLAITLIWSFVESLFALPHQLWIGAVIAAVCGVILFASDATDPKRAPEPRTPLRVLAAVVNTILLFNAASGSHDLAVRGMQPPTTVAASAKSPAP